MKKFFTLFAALTASCGLMMAQDSATNIYGLQGAGTQEDPYQLTTAADFQTLAEKITAENTGAGEYFKVMSYIDFAGAAFPSIAKGGVESVTKVNWGFEGTIDGDYNYLSGINHTANGNDADGKFNALVSSLGQNGVIKNLRFGDGNVISSYNYVAPFASISKGLIENCNNYAEVTAANAFAAGICGYLVGGEGTIKNCANYGNVTASTYACGIVAGSQSGSSITAYNYLVSGCENHGTLHATNATTSGCGGIAGSYSGRIYGCDNFGNVDEAGKQYVGGILAFGAYAVDVEYCTNSGIVAGGKKVGGIVAHVGQEGAVVDGCVSGTIDLETGEVTGSVSGTENVGGIIGNSAKADTKVLHSVCVAPVSADGVETAGHLIGNAAITVEDSYYETAAALPLDAEGQAVTDVESYVTSNWLKVYEGTMDLAVGNFGVVSTVENAQVAIYQASSRTATVSVPQIAYNQMIIDSFTFPVSYQENSYTSAGYEAQAGTLAVTGYSFDGTVADEELNFSTMLKAGKMPMNMTITFKGSEVKDVPTAIEEVAAPAAQNTVRYDLQGRQIDAQQGLFIQNGRVCIIK